jgi:inorganic pyrophosphatase
MVFPYDFGFIPSTLGQDVPVVPGCVVRARLLGAIEAAQKEKSESWTRNDRLVAVAASANTHDSAKKLADLRPHLVTEIKKFFHTYNKLRGRKFKAIDPGEARKLIDEGMKAFRKKRRPRKG